MKGRLTMRETSDSEKKTCAELTWQQLILRNAYSLNATIASIEKCLESSDFGSTNVSNSTASTVYTVMEAKNIACLSIICQLSFIKCISNQIFLKIPSKCTF